MRETMHRFLRWFPVWALGTALSFVALAIAAAQVWPGAKRWDEAQRDKVLASMSEPLFWLFAVLVVAIWAYATWHTWPARDVAAGPSASLSVDDHLREIGARRKAEALADVLYPRRNDPPAERRYHSPLLSGLREALEEGLRGELSPEAEWPMWQAVQHVSSVIGDQDEQGCYAETLRVMRQAALDGMVTIRGRRELEPPAQRAQHSEIWTNIPVDYWMNHKINSMAAGEHWAHCDHTWGEPLDNRAQDRYFGLKVRRSEIERQWPGVGK